MQFANPAALWLLTAAIPLASMYFLKVRRRRVEVPSVMLWSDVLRNERRARPWDRFRKHWLFLLQLLALLLLTLALAAPTVPGTKALGRSVVWVLDGSASMAARSPEPTRFAQAQHLVLGELGRLGTGDEGMLILASATPRVVVSFTRDKERLATEVRSATVSGAAGNLETAVDLAVSLTRNRPDRTVVVVTDGSDRSLDRALLRHPSVRVEQVGRPAPNVAITAIDLRRSPTVDLESELFVTLRRFGGEQQPVGIEVSLDGELVATEVVDVAADRPTGRVYRGLGDSGGLVRIRLDTGDALAVDDEAVAWLEPSRRRRVLCVACTVLTGRGLAADPRFDVVSAGAFTSAEGFDVVVFEGVAVPEDPGAPFLALGPLVLGAAEVPEEVRWPRVTAWRKSHPTLRFVEPADLNISRARPPSRGLWEPLVESNQGPLLSTGLQAGRRAVALHFRPVDSDLPLRVAYPLFLLNSVSWLTGEQGRSQQRTLAAGQPLLREGWGLEGEEVRLEAPGGDTVVAPIRDGVARFGGLDQVGVYKLMGPNGRQERVAVNLASEFESDLSVIVHEAPAASGGAPIQASAAGRVSILRPILLLIALLLVLEWVLYQKRYRDA